MRLGEFPNADSSSRLEKRWFTFRLLFLCRGELHLLNASGVPWNTSTTVEIRSHNWRRVINPFFFWFSWPPVFPLVLQSAR